MKFRKKLKYEPHPERQDAIWFYGDNYVGEVSVETDDGKTYSLDIYCDGETRFDVPYVNEDGSFDTDNFQVIRYEADWLGIGVKSDKELNETMEYWNGQGVEIHRFNSWFDLYTEIDGVSEHLDAVTHELPDAVSQAEAILSEVVASGGWREYLDTLYK